MRLDLLLRRSPEETSFMRNLIGTLCLTLAVLLGSAGMSWSAELKPLSKILRSETSESMSTYATERCSALYLSLSGLLLNRPNNRSIQEISKGYLKISRELAALALWSNQKMNPSFTIQDLQNILIRIRNAYDQKWKENHALTGHNIGDMTKDDVATCNSLAK